MIDDSYVWDSRATTRAATCPVCCRSIETLNAVQSKRSEQEGLIVREPTFVYHFDPKRGRECLASRKTLTEAEGIAFP